MSDVRRRATIRHLQGRAEYEAAVAIQERIWGKNFGERVAPAILHVAQRVGGVTGGAFSADGSLVGFVFGITGVEDGRPVHWSDMLAVLPDWRGRGLGVDLKMFQRSDLLERGISTMYWTFDPLEARNAYLNLARLGAVSREYVTDMYGTPTSPLHRGIGTDRLVILWEMDSERVEARLREGPPEGTLEPAGTGVAVGVEDAASGGSSAAPSAPDLSLEGCPAVSVAVPQGIQELKEQNPSLALRWREATRTALAHYIDRGFEVRELIRDEDGGGPPRYLLVREREDEANHPPIQKGGVT